jgi:hypothetical protein
MAALKFARRASPDVRERRRRRRRRRERHRRHRRARRAPRAAARRRLAFGSRNATDNTQPPHAATRAMDDDDVERGTKSATIAASASSPRAERRALLREDGRGRAEGVGRRAGWRLAAVCALALIGAGAAGYALGASHRGHGLLAWRGGRRGHHHHRSSSSSGRRHRSRRGDGERRGHRDAATAVTSAEARDAARIGVKGASRSRAAALAAAPEFERA